MAAPSPARISTGGQHSPLGFPAAERASFALDDARQIQPDPRRAAIDSSLVSAFLSGRPGGHSLGHLAIAFVAQPDEARQDFGVDLLEAGEIETSAADLVRTQIREEARIGLKATREV